MWTSSVLHCLIINQSTEHMNMLIWWWRCQTCQKVTTVVTVHPEGNMIIVTLCFWADIRPIHTTFHGGNIAPLIHLYKSYRGRMEEELTAKTSFTSFNNMAYNTEHVLIVRCPAEYKQQESLNWTQTHTAATSGRAHLKQKQEHLAVTCCWCFGLTQDRVNWWLSANASVVAIATIDVAYGKRRRSCPLMCLCVQVFSVQNKPDTCSADVWSDVSNPQLLYQSFWLCISNKPLLKTHTRLFSLFE